MEVTVCQCRKCGRYHVFEKIGTRDIHVCECGERIERWTHRMEKCETEKEPNEPLGAWKRNGTDPVWHGDNSPEMVIPNKPHEKKCKPIRNDILDAMTYAFCIHNEEATRKYLCKEGRLKKANPAFAFIDDNHKLNVVPIVSIGTKSLVFETDTKLTVWAKMEFEREYTQRLGIDCVVIDGGNKLAAIIDG